VVVTLVTVTGLSAVVLRWIFTASLGYVVTSLAHASACCVSIFPLTAGITEINGTGHAAFFNVSSDQVDVRTFCVGGIVWIKFNVCTVTVITLDVLAARVVILFIRMTVCTDIELIWRREGNFCPAAVGTQLIAIAGAQIGIVSPAFDRRGAVECRTAGIGIMNTVTGSADNISGWRCLR